jgi:phosphoribosylanthranilate isomerase
MIVKICGLSTPETMATALDAGADMVGLVFHPKSPRFVSLAVAAELAEMARGQALVTALLVDPDDETVRRIAGVIDPDVIQLHGSEDADRIREVTALADRPVMKAVGVATANDLAAIPPLAKAAASILLDAKPPKDAAYPGGHGRPFDWLSLAALDPRQEFMLSGGLTPENAADAIRAVRDQGNALQGVDVSSGVESAPGIKDAKKIRAFVENAHKATSS